VAGNKKPRIVQGYEGAFSRVTPLFFRQHHDKLFCSASIYVDGEGLDFLYLGKSKKMAHWLVKSEPSSYSWDQLVKDGVTTWDGVRNFAARNHLRAMKKNDEVLFYHSNVGVEIVGIAKVTKEAFQDPTTSDENWVTVELKPVKRLKHPVSLAAIKEHPQLKNMALVRISRLSVQPVTEEEWDIVMKLGK